VYRDYSSHLNTLPAPVAGYEVKAPHLFEDFY